MCWRCGSRWGLWWNFQIVRDILLERTVFVDLFILLYGMFPAGSFSFESHWIALRAPVDPGWSDGPFRNSGARRLGCRKNDADGDFVSIVFPNDAWPTWVYWFVKGVRGCIWTLNNFSPMQSRSFRPAKPLRWPPGNHFWWQAFWSSTSEVWWICMHQFPSSCQSLKPQWWVPRGESETWWAWSQSWGLIGWMMDVMYGLYEMKPMTSEKRWHTAAQQLWCCFRVPLVRPISVHDLLAHTSGIGFGPGFGYEPENAYEISYVPLVRKVDLGEIQSLAEWCQELAKVPLRLVRGIQIHYACRFFLSSCMTTIQMK